MTKTLLRTIVVFCSLVGAAAAFLPQSSAGVTFAEPTSARLTEIRSLLFAESAMKATGLNAASLSSTTPRLEKEIELEQEAAGSRGAVAVLSGRASAKQTLMWTVAVFGIGIALVLIIRRRPRRRRQKLVLDVGRFPLVLPHLRANEEHDKQQKL